MNDASNPDLGFAPYRYSDLYDLARLAELAGDFDRFLGADDPSLFARFDVYRNAATAGEPHGGLAANDEANLLVDVSRTLSTFLIRLFGVDTEVARQRERAERDSEVAAFKKDVVTKRIAKLQNPPTDDAQLAQLDAEGRAVVTALAGIDPDADAELAVARAMNRLLALEREYPRSALATMAFAPSAEGRAAVGRLRGVPGGNPAGDTPEALADEAIALHAILDRATEWLAGRWRKPLAPWTPNAWTSFRLPHALKFDDLVPLQRADETHVIGDAHHLRRRDGFKLTDPRMTPREITDEAHYCIFCHQRNKDSCSHGFPEKGGFKVNPLGMPLEGCPLDEKIGETNLLRSEGNAVAGLAMVMVDNPMCPGTGHRICNDCMRSCIFQKQEPVNIPQLETGVLTDVLALPWGFEIYSLLTRWNPLNVRRPVALPYNGRNVLVVGLGPAGYTLAHYLANEGFGVVAVDALKIEPLPDGWIARDAGVPTPIVDARSLWEELDDRILAGFGGVSEYGITVRWDKNFLKLIRLALERRGNLKVYGGVRFGGTITIDDVFDRLGFDHIAIAAGAGTPTIVRMKNNLIRGIRKASDFLMALQLTGAFKKGSMANLQVRLPAVVIGGGLTAVDTATELFAYYPIQVEKVLERYETLARELDAATPPEPLVNSSMQSEVPATEAPRGGGGEAVIRAGYDAEELQILDELLLHGRAVRAERERAAAAGELPDFVPLVRGWGGVTIAYRKSLLDSPAYRLNYEEVAKAMEEGIAYAENLSPVEALADEFGHIRSLVFSRQAVEDGRWHDSGETVELPARSVMVAAGTSPNVIYEKEHPGTFKLDKYGQFFQSHGVSIGADGGPELLEIEEPTDTGFFTSYQHASAKEKLVSFYGDNHPRYAGNVVKAMASAKYGYPHVTALFAGALAQLDRSADAQAARDARWSSLTSTLDDAFFATVHAVNRLTPTIVEVVVRAPYAAQKFQPGQFFRLQNFEAHAAEVDGTKLVMEGLALTGAWTDKEQGLLSTVVLEMGGSSRLCAYLRPGEPLVLMGPTGTPTEIPRDETVLLAGGGLGNAVLFSIAKALKDNGCRVLYFAGYKKAEDVFKRDEIEAGTDQVVWSVDAGAPIAPRRPQDLSFTGNIVQSMLHYASGALLARPENEGRGEVALSSLAEVRRIIAIGSDGMMRAVKEARHGVLAPHLSPTHIGIGSINSPMQCMMKQVCAQCLQRHVDPVTGKESFIFSCFNQDQPLDDVDFPNLRARLRQNTVLEKLTNLWLTRLLARDEATDMQFAQRGSAARIVG